MSRGRFTKLVGLAVISGLVGYLLGPPIAQAAANLVTIKDPRTKQKARVTRGNLWVDASGSEVVAFTAPWGETVLVSSSSSASRSGNGDLVGISVDVAEGAGGPVTVTLRKGTTVGSGQIIWRGTVPTGGGHLSDTLPFSIWLPSGGFNVQVVNSSGGDVQYQVYGAGFGVPFSRPAPPR